MNKNFELLKQLRVAFIGIPDTGKSTLISSLIKYLHGKSISPDTLMNEVHYTSGKDIYGNDDTRTIRAAKILCSYRDYEIMFIDCPGHLEYFDQIKQGIDMASIIVCLIDYNRQEESRNYCKELIKTTHSANKHVLTFYTHSPYNYEDYFEANLLGTELSLEYLLESIDRVSNIRIDVEEEALNIARETLLNYEKICLMFSGGKDSIVGNNICLKTLSSYNKIFNRIWPKSGFDFLSLERFIEENYKVIPLNNLPEEMTYENNTTFDIHLEKGKFNNSLEHNYDLMIINYRASDEGVRSKDHYIKPGNCSSCQRFSPVFYFSEENIWRYIAKHSLKFPEIYFSGYRSLGDEPVTKPSMPECETVNEIIDYIHNHPFEERDGRKAQDNSVDFGMEKLRDNGFF